MPNNPPAPHLLRRPSVLVPLALLAGLSFSPAAAQAAKLITGKDIKDSSITSADVKNGSLRSADFAPGDLPAGPAGPTGPAGAEGPRGVSAWDTIPTGTTVTGRFYETFEAVAPNQYLIANIELPAQAPEPLISTRINFAPDSSAVTSDDDASCTGTYLEPTAPPGQVCIYAGRIPSGVTNLAGYMWADVPHRSYAFFVQGAGPAVAPSPPTQTQYWASWAYTAP